MRWPWISRDSHEEIVRMLREQVWEMTAERKVLLDRLGALGLGGPLFHLPAPEQIVEPKEEEATEDEDWATMQRLSRTPSKLAAYLTKKAYRDRNKVTRGPAVARIPDERITAALDAAEALGKKQA